MLSYVAKIEEITPYAWLYKNIDDFRGGRIAAQWGE